LRYTFTDALAGKFAIDQIIKNPTTLETRCYRRQWRIQVWANCPNAKLPFYKILSFDYFLHKNKQKSFQLLGTELAGAENDGLQYKNSWNMQDLKMTDQIARMDK